MSEYKEFPEDIGGIIDRCIEVKDELDVAGRKRMRIQFKLIDQAYKESLDSKAEVVKEFATSLVEYVNTTSKKVWKAIKQLKNVRIVLKKDETD